MKNIVDFPFLVFVFSFLALWLSALAGTFVRKKQRSLEQGTREDLNVVQAASLTLLGLLIGFTFSMAISRYEQRKNCEETEANAIGTEYFRADLLPSEEKHQVQELLKKYLDLRVLFYSTRDEQQLRQIDPGTVQLQNNLWSAVLARAVAQPSPMMALVVSGMNDVLNSQGYTEAAWKNRIPFEAWVLLAAIAIGCNFLIGYGAHRARLLLIVLPLAVSLSFFLITDIDSPRGGVIRVRPQNLLSLSQTLNTH